MTTQQLPPLPEQSMTHHITDEQIAKLHDSMFPAPYDGHANVVRFARAVLAIAAPAPAVPSIDYMALIDAARVRHKYAQGTRACVAFKHGAEWFREQALTAAHQPAKEQR